MAIKAAECGITANKALSFVQRRQLSGKCAVCVDLMWNDCLSACLSLEQRLLGLGELSELRRQQFPVPGLLLNGDHFACLVLSGLIQ